MSIQCRGFSNVIAEVNSDRELATALTREHEKAGFAALACEVDDGTISGARRTLPIDASRDFRIRSGLDSKLFEDIFVGTTVNTKKWLQSLTTQTVTVGGNQLTLNGSNITTLSTVSRISSYKTFPTYTSYPLYVEMRAGYFGTALGIPNAFTDWGFGNVTGTTQLPIDAARFVSTYAGALLGSVTFNSGTELTVDLSVKAVAAGAAVNEFQNYLIVVDVGEIVFYVNNKLCGKIDIPVGNAYQFSAAALPVYARTMNNAVAPASAVQLRLGSVAVSQGDMNSGMAYEVQASSSGDNAVNAPTGTATAQTTNWANSAAPAAATLSNTAAGYTTQGGQFLFNAPAGAETDYALFAFQVPALAANAKAPSHLTYGVSISALNVGAAVATTATSILWGIGVGSNAVSLATADAATTRAYARETLGHHTWAVGAAIGSSGGPDIVRNFRVPYSAEAGTFVAVICKVFLGTATASQQIRGCVSLDRHWG